MFFSSPRQLNDKETTSQSQPHNLSLDQHISHGDVDEYTRSLKLPFSYSNRL